MAQVRGLRADSIVVTGANDLEKVLKAASLVVR
jgi:hypothetical protein